MYCSNCGKENPEGALFCGSCGQQIANTSQERKKSQTFLDTAIRGATMGYNQYKIKSEEKKQKSRQVFNRVLDEYEKSIDKRNATEPNLKNLPESNDVSENEISNNDSETEAIVPAQVNAVDSSDTTPSFLDSAIRGTSIVSSELKSKKEQHRMKKEAWNEEIKDAKTDKVIIIGFILSCSFVFSLVGVVVLFYGLWHAKQNKKKGRQLAIAGIAIGFIVSIIGLFSLAYILPFLSQIGGAAQSIGNAADEIGGLARDADTVVKGANDIIN